jgi:hypothetical protein
MMKRIILFALELLGVVFTYLGEKQDKPKRKKGFGKEERTEEDAED